MIKKYSLVFVAFLCFVLSGFGQTTLTNGDIAIIGIDTPGEDFSFVTFIPLSPGTTIYFTDEEADNDYTIGTGEGTVLYTTPASGAIAGEVISYLGNSSDFSTTSDGLMALSNSGDGIIAYQGTSVGNVDRFLHAVAKNTGTLGTFPGGFTNYILIANDDGEYNGVRTGGTAVSYLTDINNLANWTTFGSGVIPFDLTFFTFGTPTCNISNSAISNISCNDNGTTTDDTDDYITFDLNPVGSTLGTNYNVSVSSGSISPTTAAYGSVTTFTLQNGSAGAGNVTVALTDDTDGTCTLNQLITDPGSCMSGSCTELFISEYVEGSGNNKYIEIYNPTNGSINLSGYQLATYFNGNSTPSTLALSGSIGSYSTYVI